jgi:hypothetical protein
VKINKQNQSIDWKAKIDAPSTESTKAEAKQTSNLNQHTPALFLLYLTKQRVAITTVPTLSKAEDRAVVNTCI